MSFPHLELHVNFIDTRIKGQRPRESSIPLLFIFFILCLHNGFETMFVNWMYIDMF